MRIKLTMDEETARVLMRAADFYSRVICGQYEIITDDVMGIRSGQGDQRPAEVPDADFNTLLHQKREAEQFLMQAKHAQFPEMDAMIGQHWGLGYSRKTDIAYNIYQAINYAFLQSKKPEEDLGNWDKPTAWELPYPSVDIDGREYLSGHFDVD